MMFVGITIQTIYGISGNELPPPQTGGKRTAELINADNIKEALSIMADKVLPLRRAAEKVCEPYSSSDGYSWDVIELAQDTPTVADYKAALHAAMLYVAAIVHDINHSAKMPSERSQRLLSELSGNHSEAIKALAQS